VLESKVEFSTIYMFLLPNFDLIPAQHHPAKTNRCLGYHYGRVYEPLMKFIALRSIEQISESNFADEERPSGIVRRQSTTVDESREKGQRFVNPSLIAPLEKMWIDVDSDEFDEPNGDSSALLHRDESIESTQSLGDTHIWREPQ